MITGLKGLISMSGVAEDNLFYGKILDSIWTGVWVVDRDDRIIFFNRGMEDIFDTTKEAVMGNDVLKYIKEQSMRDQKHFCELFCRVKRTLRPAPYDSFSMTTRDGKLTYQSGVLIPLLDDNGNYDGMVGTVEDITRQALSEKQALDTLKAEKELETIYKSSPVVAFLWLTGRNRKVEYVSDNISQFGYTPEDLISGKMNYAGMVFPDDLEMLRFWMFWAEQEGDHYFSREYRILSESGEIHWVSERSLILRDENGKPAYYQGIVIDISELKTSQRARLEAERKYRLIFENSPLGIFDFDKEGIVRHCNSTLIKILGLPEEEIIGFNLMTSLRDNRMKAAFESVFSKRSGYYEGEYRSTTCDKITPIRAYYSPNLAEDGSVLGGIGIIEDITERKKVYDSLKTSEEKYSSLVENSNDGIVIVQDGILSFVNSKFESLTGYLKEQIVGKLFLDFVSPEYRNVVLDTFTNTSEKDSSILHKYEIHILSREGPEIPVELSVSPISYEGRPADMAIIRDITERKRAEKALKKYACELSEANEELKSLDRMKDEFLSNISHELNTPIVSIKGYSNLIYDGTLGSINDRQKDALKVVLRNIQRLISVVNSLLYISMMQSDTVEYRFEEIRITDIINNVLDDMIFHIENRGIVLEKRVPSDLPPVKADREKLAILFTNLMDNAIKFTNPGGKIVFEVEEEDGEKKLIHMQITDTGIGIPEDLLPNIFRRFYQVDASTRRRYGGTGLGLYISKSIVDAHKGQIWVESEKNVGTTVHVILPEYESSVFSSV